MSELSKALLTIHSATTLMKVLVGFVIKVTVL
jgi:hypothetical protein